MTTESQLQRSAPEAQGIASAAIQAFVAAVEQNIRDLHSFMLVRHDRVVAEGWWAPYAPEYPHMLFSLSKSFTSTAIGLAVAEGRLTVDDPVLAFFPDDAPAEVSKNLADMRVRHLLAMSTGHADDTMGPLRARPDGHWVKAFLACPVEYTPGTHFLYNTGATYMLSAIIQQLTGDTLLNYLWPRLLTPLGIEQASWQTCPRGINTGGFGLSVKTNAIARFGQMYLQKGMWNGQQLVPAAWVAEATSLQTPNSSPNIDWRQGYGYQFWLCQHDAYRGDGAFGQFCVVMPEQDAVLAITAGVSDMQSVLDLVWEHLLPAMGASPLPADPAAQAKLAQTLSNLTLTPQQGQPSSALAARVSGQTYRFDANEHKIETITLDFSTAKPLLTIRRNQGDHTVTIGSGAWLAGTTDHDGTEDRIAASGAWAAEDTYVVQVFFTETPFSWTFTLRFVDDRLVYDFAQNVSFGDPSSPQLEGRLVASPQSVGS
jgi:CubicO group peptidase (beta-lactamase class C family)